MASPVRKAAQKLRAHPWWTLLGSLGFAGALNLLGWVFTGVDIMQALFGPDWLPEFVGSIWFRLCSIAIMVVALWRIGDLSLREERAATAASLAGSKQGAEETAAALRRELEDQFGTALAIARRHEKNRRVEQLKERLNRAEQMLAFKAGAIEEVFKRSSAGENLVSSAADNYPITKMLNELREIMGNEEKWRPPAHPPRQSSHLSGEFRFSVAENAETLRDWTDDLAAAKIELMNFRQFVEAEELELGRMPV